eukprot:PDM62414.1 hypothetical protein PRIPAC_51856 [Pristionchus pacificus]
MIEIEELIFDLSPATTQILLSGGGRRGRQMGCTRSPNVTSGAILRGKIVVKMKSVCPIMTRLESIKIQQIGGFMSGLDTLQ